jgi:hypothetical protein
MAGKPTNAKCFKCNTCDYSTTVKGSLKSHTLRRHNPNKDFKCDHCDKAFSIKPSLVDHVNRIHKKIKRHSCEFCDFTSCNKQELKRHSNRMHNPKKAHRPDLDALMKVIQKEKMFESLEKNLPKTYTDYNYFEAIQDTLEIEIKEEEILETMEIEIKEEFVADLLD